MAPTNFDKAVADRQGVSDNLDMVDIELKKHPTDPLLEASVNLLLQMVTKAQTEIVEINSRIVHCAPADPDVHRNAYQVLFSKSLLLFNNLTKIKMTFAPTPSTTQSSTSDVRLPRLELPTFEGDLFHWVSFRDIFHSAIHNNSSLSKSQKLTYLKGQLKGEAARQISSMLITDANYDIAWNQLTDRYQNDREIFFAILRRFFGQSNVQSNSSLAIRQLIDISRESIRSLDVLKLPTSHWDAIFMFSIVEKMDKFSKELWEQGLKDSSIPTLTSLFEFLEQRARALTAGGHDSKGDGRKASSAVKSSDKAPSQSTRPYAYHIKSASCHICNGASHPAFKCSNFIKMTVPVRLDAIKRAGNCFNCLSNGHTVGQCPCERRCKTCQGKHHTLLHRPEAHSNSTDKPQVNSAPAATFHTHTPYHAHTQEGPKEDISMQQTSTYEPMLSTLAVLGEDSRGHHQPLRLFADNGCNSNYATEACIRRLGLLKKRCIMPATGLGDEMLSTATSYSWISISPHFDTSVKFHAKVFILPKLTCNIPSSPINPDRFPHLQTLNLADPLYFKSQPVDLLFGAEFFFHILKNGKKTGLPGNPVAINSSFGWMVGGGGNSESQAAVHSTNSVPFTASNAREELNLDSILLRFWEQEEDHSTPIMTSEEEECEKHFQSNHERLDNGKFMVRLPFKSQTNQLGSSLDTAVRRFNQLERRLKSNEIYKQEYVNFMDEYLVLGHMEEVSSLDVNLKGTYYIPHHFVLKKDSTTTKFRVVFDASAKTSTGQSLNDNLMVGPTVQDCLMNIIIRFRLHKIAFTADITKMYRQIVVNPEDTDFQRIVWRPDPSLPLKHYRLTTVTYGTASAPYLATKALQELARVNKDNCPLGSEILSQDFYVDDLMSGCASEELALKAQQELLKLIQSGGMELRKWTSNSEALLSSLPPRLRETQTLLNLDPNESIKALGIYWNPKEDKFSFKADLPDMGGKLYTKRTLLSEISTIFDPIGWLAPLIIVAKTLMQSVHQLKTGWDEPLPTCIHQQWISFRSDLVNLTDLHIPRYYLSSSSLKPISDLDTYKYCLIGFSDASERAFSAVVYLGVYYNHQPNLISLVMSKTRVAPCKTISIPRLELCGAELLAKLLERTKSALRIPIHSISAWTDSTITLNWIQSHPSRWKTYVANRVTKIQQRISPELWGHVPGHENPADCASRGISVSELIDHNLWWTGPPWLRDGIPDPNNSDFRNQIREKTDEVMKEERQVVFTSIVNPFAQDMLKKYSSLLKLQRVTAYILRFFKNCRSKIRPVAKHALAIDPLTPAELSQSLICFIRIVQSESFSDEIKSLTKGNEVHSQSKIKSLNPYLDSSHVIRVGGRLQNSQLTYTQKHPIILPRHGYLTNLIITHEHLMNFHAGPQLMWSSIRSKFWIINAKDSIRQIIQKCVTCTRYKKKTMEQIMGNLPSFRVNAARPFLQCGLDYAGPLQHRPLQSRSKVTLKAYLAIFICCTTRAIHIEVVSELSTAAFLAALRRFVSRRGRPSHIYSDCGTNFVGADAEMKSLLKFMHSAQHNTTISDEVSTQIEAILNSRPLTPESSDPDDLSALTPGHFLVGSPLNSVPDPSLEHLKMNTLSRWQLLQKMIQDFWKRWSNEYLTRLHQRPKWMTKQIPIQVGHMVLIKEDNLPPQYWKLGRVSEIHPGKDAIPRVVSLKTSKGIIKRPIVKLCLLPISTNPEDCN